MSKWRSFRALAGTSLTLFLVGCSSQTSLRSGLDERWQWDGGIEASHVLTAIDGKKAPVPVPAAVGITGAGLVGRTLPDGEAWTYKGKVDVLPHLLGDAVLFTGEGRVVMLDVKTGKKRFDIDSSGRRLEGAGYDGENAILLLVDSDDAREDQILVVGKLGLVKSEATALARLGTPAIVGGVGLVPYSGQYVAGFETDTGKLIGRVLFRDNLHTVHAEGSDVILLGSGASELHSGVTSSPQAKPLRLEPRKLPGHPEWPTNGSKPRPARSKPVALYAHPEKREGKMRFAGDGYVGSYYEIAVGFDHGSNDVRWATSFDRDITGGDSNDAGVTLCLEDGSLWQLSWKDGTRAPRGSLGTQLEACVVSASTDRIDAKKENRLFDQIAETVAKTGPNMVAMQKILVKELAKQPSSDTTLALLELAQNPLVSSDLAKDAAGLLSKQDEGLEHMLAALRESTPQPLELPKAEQPKGEEEAKDAADSKEGASQTPGDAPDKVEAKSEEANQPPSSDQSEDESWTDENDDWAEDDDWEEESGAPAPVASDEKVPDMPPPVESTAKRRSKRPPPVGAIAKALLRNKTPGSAEALAPYLADPSLRPADANSAMKTIYALGSPTEVEAVHAFLENYKNTGGEKTLISALVQATFFLLRHMGEEEKAELKEELRDPLTHPDLRRELAAQAKSRRGKSEPQKPPQKESFPPTE